MKCVGFAGCIACQRPSNVVGAIKASPHRLKVSICMKWETSDKRLGPAFKESDALAISIRHPNRACAGRGAFTLLESLMATGILLLVVVAVTAALAAAQRQSYEGQQRIAAGLAAEELMSRLLVESYDDLPAWDGHSESVGEMTNVAGQPLPESFEGIGRSVTVTTSLRVVTNLNIRVRGRTVIVVAHDSSNTPLAMLTRFIPEPQA